ncbi:hypothetical protein [Nitrosomonas aestuarii]|uniref:hypothetical protein n=1 Tax=Nitrosomonas aestuarii TaxID=52441 RepID=UPI000D309E22|nr:hypothetical protein [Nitrosomonas aestuarii]
MVWPLPDEWDDARLEQILFPETYKDSALEQSRWVACAKHYALAAKVNDETGAMRVITVDKS